MAGPSYVLGRFYTAGAGLPPSGASVRLPCSVTAAPRRLLAHTVPSLVLNSDQDLTMTMTMMTTMMMMILLE